MTSTATATSAAADWKPLRAPLVLCGIGFGGFFDGIVFHQIFQLHHMLSNAGDDRIGLDVDPVTTVAGLELNTLWDGLFHAFTYVVLLAGVFWLWSRWQAAPAARPPWRLLIGGLLAGWGTFNVVEGLVNHHLLAIHHVVEGDHSTIFDLVFLAVGLVMIATGARLMRPATDSSSS